MTDASDDAVQNISKSDKESDLKFFPVAIGIYDHHSPLNVDGELVKIRDILSEFGLDEIEWRLPMEDRGADAVNARLRAWASIPGEENTIVYWIGHGWSDGIDAALAHARSPLAVYASGVLPVQIAQTLLARQAEGTDGWTVLIVDACWSSRFIQQVNSALSVAEFESPLLYIGTSGDGAVALGQFSSTLSSCIQETFRTEKRISLWQLVAELDRRLPTGLVSARKLGASTLSRRLPPVAGRLNVTLEILTILERALAAVPESDRRHFLTKARSAQDTESTWFFEGRQQEFEALARWLRNADSGLMLVTGQPGAGKSALLGNLLLQSIPVVRDVLSAGNLLTEISAVQLPQDVFNAVVHLSGVSVNRLLDRLLSAAGNADFTLVGRRDASSKLNLLIKILRSRNRPFTILLDALDEAEEPLAVIHLVVRALMDVPGVRVIVGTRSFASTHRPEVNSRQTDLIRALNLAISGTAIGRLDEVVVRRDASAIHRYVERRLRVANEQGKLFNGASEGIMQDAAARVSARSNDFLFAQLVVHEIVADATLLTQARKKTFHLLLTGDHEDVFNAAVQRLSRTSDANFVLFEALAFGRGRGLPIRDGIWIGIAASLVSPTFRGLVLSDSDIGTFLDAASPYIVADTEFGQTVYRLAHRTFVEHFWRKGLRSSTVDAAVIARQDKQTSITYALMDTLKPGRQPNPYIARHLTGHVAEADAWQIFLEDISAIDSVNPYAALGDAMRTIVGLRPVPEKLIGLIADPERIMRASSNDRAGVRQISSALLSRAEIVAESVTSEKPWSLDFASLRANAFNVSLSGHTGYVRSLCSLKGPGGENYLASAGGNGEVRIWDWMSATPAGPPLHIYDGIIEHVCSFELDGRSQVAAACGDGSIRIWDPERGVQNGPIIQGHIGPALALCAMPYNGRVILVSAGSDGRIGFWDPETGLAVRPQLRGHEGPVRGLCSATTGDSSLPKLVSAGSDGWMRIWNLASGTTTCQAVFAHSGGVSDVCELADSGPDSFIATGGNDGNVQIWNAETLEKSGDPLGGHSGGINCVTPFRNHTGRQSVAVAVADGSVHLWDALSGERIGPILKGHAGTVRSLAALLSQAGRALVATGGGDGMVKIWSPPTEAPDISAEPKRCGPSRGMCIIGTDRDNQNQVAVAGSDGCVTIWDTGGGLPMRRLRGHAGPVWGVCYLNDPEGRELLATSGADGKILVWDLATSSPIGMPLQGHVGTVSTLCRITNSSGTDLLVSGGGDGAIRVWDPVSGDSLGVPMVGHVGLIWKICEVRLTSGKVLIGSAGGDGTLRLWDPDKFKSVGSPMVGHDGTVRGGLCAVAQKDEVLLASAGNDGTVRLWDPINQCPVGVPLTGHTGTVVGICSFHEDGVSKLASASLDGSVRVWDLASGTSRTITTKGSEPWGIITLPRGASEPQLAFTCNDGSVRLCDLNRTTLWGPPMIYDGASVTDLTEIGTRNQGSTILMVSADATLSALVDQRRETHALKGLRACCVRMVPSSDHRGRGDIAIVGGIDGTISRIDVDLLVVTATIATVTGAAPLDVCPLPGPESRIAVVDADGGIGVYRLSRNRIVVSTNIADRVRSRTLALISDNERSVMAAASDDGSVWMWDAQNFEERGRVGTGHESAILASCAVRDIDAKGRIATGGADGVVMMHDLLDTRAHRIRMGGHLDQVTCIAQIRCGDGSSSLLLSGSLDGTVKLWSPQTGVLVHSIEIGIPVNKVLARATSSRRQPETDSSNSFVVGTREGALSINLHQSFFSAYRR